VTPEKIANSILHRGNPGPKRGAEPARETEFTEGAATNKVKAGPIPAPWPMRAAKTGITPHEQNVRARPMVADSGYAKKGLALSPRAHETVLLSRKTQIAPAWRNAGINPPIRCVPMNSPSSWRPGQRTDARRGARKSWIM